MTLTNQLDRRQFVQLTMASSAGLTLGITPRGRLSAQDSGTPVRGGTLRIGITEDPANLNPYGPGGAWVKRNVLRTIFDSLVEYNDEGTWVPALAEAWTVAPDGMAIDFTLRQGVMFHDGTPCDGEAIKRVIDMIWLDEETGSAALRNVFAAAELVDATTLQLQLKQPDVTAFARINTAMIVSPTAYESLGPDAFGLNPSGTGAFKFVSWANGSELIVERNPSYWNPERPYLDGITWSVVGDPTIRIINLTSGNLDAATFIPASEVEQLQAEDGIEIAVSTGGYTGLMMNLTSAPLDQLANREAFLAAIDYDAVTKAVYFGLAEPATGGFTPPTNFAFNADLPSNRRDLDLARAKLAEAGNPDGFALTATFEPGNQVATRLMEVIQAMVAEVGITLTLEQYDRGRFSEIISTDHQAVQMVQYDIAYIHPAPELRYVAFTSCDSPNNFAEWCNEDFMAALNEAMSATDQAAEIEALQRAEEILIAEKPYASLVWLPFSHSWRDQVRDFGIDYAGDIAWQDAWIAES